MTAAAVEEVQAFRAISGDMQSVGDLVVVFEGFSGDEFIPGIVFDEEHVEVKGC